MIHEEIAFVFSHPSLLKLEVLQPGDQQLICNIERCHGSNIHKYNLVRGSCFGGRLSGTEGPTHFLVIVGSLIATTARGKKEEKVGWEWEREQFKSFSALLRMASFSPCLYNWNSHLKGQEHSPFYSAFKLHLCCLSQSAQGTGHPQHFTSLGDAHDSCGSLTSAIQWRQRALTATAVPTPCIRQNTAGICCWHQDSVTGWSFTSKTV